MALSEIYIDQSVAESSLVRKICHRLGLPHQTVGNAQQVYNIVSSADDPVKKGKEILFLTKNKGAFVKKCPGTRHYTCCDYGILHIGTYCDMDCAYCIMQTYFHPPVLQYFVNHDDLIKELEQLFSRHAISRIGTGEFTDSLIWEKWTDISSLLVNRFAEQNKAVLEIKSKTTIIENLKDLNHQRKTILSWSLNTPHIIMSEERSTATLSARLRAAARCESWGYPLAFHFDPMLIYSGCEDSYHDVVKQLFSYVSSENIVWISLGTFRFPQALKKMIKRRFPHSSIPYGEFVAGLDGKMRYFKPLRIALYRHMTTVIKEYAPNVTIYFCMEDNEVWYKSLGYVPADRGGLTRILDESAVLHCSLDPMALKGDIGEVSDSQKINLL
jgi:spore photoproduct lyase